MKNEIYLFNKIMRAIRTDNLDEANRAIDEEIAMATPITFDDFINLQPEDGDNFIINIKEEREIVNFTSLIFENKRTTITIKGSKNPKKIIEYVKFPVEKSTFRIDQPKLTIGHGIVLIFEDSDFIVGPCYPHYDLAGIQVNGGIFVAKENIYLNEIDIESESRLPNENYVVFGKDMDFFDPGGLRSNGKGIKYNYTKKHVL